MNRDIPKILAELSKRYPEYEFIVRLKNINGLIEKDKLQKKTYNCLISAGITTISDLVKMSGGDLLLIKGIGKKAICDINDYKKHLGDKSEPKIIPGKLKGKQFIPKIQKIKFDPLLDIKIQVSNLLEKQWEIIDFINKHL